MLKFSKHRSLLLLGLFLLNPFSSAPALSETTEATADALKGLKDRVSSYRLDNGLRVLFVKRDIAPVFAAQIWVKVGGVNEVPGKTGAAHLLEHMAFKGTEEIGTKDFAKEKPLLQKLDQLMHQEQTPEVKQEQAKLYTELSKLWVDNEFSRIYQKNGAVGLNAGTGKDYTYYTVELPKNALELWCWMESERILKPVFRQFYKERDVVMEERRMRTEDSPQGRLYEALVATSYWNHPYQLPVVGWASDIMNLKLEDTLEIHHKFYRPDNIVLVLAGDIKPESALPLIKKYFGRIPKAEGALPSLDTKEPEQKGERSVQVEFKAEPVLLMGFHKPVFPNPEDIYFTLLHSYLSGGKSSLLYRELVVEKQLALAVDTTEGPGELYPSLFMVLAVPRRGVTYERLSEAIQEILERVAKKGIPEKDLEVAKRRTKVSFLSQLDSNGELAETIGHSELLYGDWKKILEMYQLINSAGVKDVQALAEKYLQRKNRTVATLVKPADLKPAE